MTPLADILAAAKPVEDGGFTSTIPADWMQGRTSYGGLSAALALHAAMACEPDLPPLGSALISFIGPLAGDVSVTARKLRRGRTTAFIEADVTSSAGLGLRATFAFMTGQASQIDHDRRPRRPLSPPAPGTKLYTGPEEFFTGNFNFLDIKDDSLAPAEILRWSRLRASDGLHPMIELIAVADALPPAAHRLVGNVMVPVSSVTWQINLLSQAPGTTDGWWLLHAVSDYARNGISSQSMSIANASGELVATGMQSVAIFI